MKQLLLENKNLYAYRILEMTGTRERKRKELARSAQKLKPHSKCFIHALSAAEPFTFSVHCDRFNFLVDYNSRHKKTPCLMSI